MIGLFRWIWGYVRFDFRKGFCENFLTDCYSQGFEIRDVSLNEDGFTAYCNLKTYKQLHHIARLHGGVVKITKKCGLPFLALPLKNRIGFAVGAAAFILIVSFLSTFVWNVEITGNDAVGTFAINAFLENNNLKSGVMWSSVDRDKLCWDMLGEFDEFSWVHINKKGSTAFVEVNEVKAMPDESDKDKLEGINVFRKELQAVAYREQKDMSVRDRKHYKKLNFFFIDIPLYTNRKTGDISQESASFITINEVALPIGITEYEEVFLSSTPKTLSDEELTQLAQKKLEYLEQQEFEGFEIINKSPDVKNESDKCTITCSYILRRK